MPIKISGANVMINRIIKVAESGCEVIGSPPGTCSVKCANPIKNIVNANPIA